MKKSSTNVVTVAAVLCITGAMFVALTGCSATLVPPDGLSDARVQAVELQRRVQELEAKSAELQAQLAAAQEHIAQINAVGAVDREVAEATPRMVTLAFAGGSAEWVAGAAASGVEANAPAVSEASEPSRHALVRVAVEPRDGLGRVLQVAGRCEVTVAIVDPAGKVIELGHRSVSPADLRASWRAAFMGTHYSLEIPVVVPASAPAKVVWTVAVSCTDGWSRQTCRTSGAVAAPRE